MENNEQWLSGGDCSKCRRQKYCKKPCALRKRIVKYETKRLAAKVMNEMTGGVMHEAIDKIVFSMLD